MLLDHDASTTFFDIDSITTNKQGTVRVIFMGKVIRIHITLPT